MTEEFKDDKCIFLHLSSSKSHSVRQATHSILNGFGSSVDFSKHQIQLYVVIPVLHRQDKTADLHVLFPTHFHDYFGTAWKH